MTSCSLLYGCRYTTGSNADRIIIRTIRARKHINSSSRLLTPRKSPAYGMIRLLSKASLRLLIDRPSPTFRCFFNRINQSYFPMHTPTIVNEMAMVSNWRLNFRARTIDALDARLNIVTLTLSLLGKLPPRFPAIQGPCPYVE